MEATVVCTYFNTVGFDRLDFTCYGKHEKVNKKFWLQKAQNLRDQGVEGRKYFGDKFCGSINWIEEADSRVPLRDFSEILVLNLNEKF